LGYRNFALYWAGFAATNAGKWVEQTGAVWVAYELSGDPLLLGLLGIARGVPALLLNSFAGVLADRLDQRRVIFLTQAAGLMTSSAVGLLIVSGHLELWHLYLQVAVQSSILAIDRTARQALFPRLVPRAHLMESVTLASAAGRSSGFIGPAIGGIAIAWLGDAAPFFLNAATFVLLMGALAAMRDVAPGTRTDGSSFWGDLVEGLRHMLRAPVLRGLLLLEIAYSVLQVNPVIITIVARDVLGVGPEGLGILLSALAGGAVLGTGTLIALGATRAPGRFVTVATILYAAAMVAFALSGRFLVAAAALVVIGLFDAFVGVTRNSIMQLAAPPAMRGRVMANQGTIVQGAGPLAQAQSGATAGLLGGQAAVIVAAGLLAVSALALGRANRSLWTYGPADADGAGFAADGSRGE
jgi:MFS family permease